MRVCAFLEMGQGVLNCHVDSSHIDRVHQVKTLHLGLFGVRQLNSAGIVDDDVDTTKGFNGFGDGGLELLFVADVALNSKSLTAGGYDGISCGVYCARQFVVGGYCFGGDGNAGSVLSGSESNCQTDASRGAGNKKNLVLEVHKFSNLS